MITIPDSSVTLPEIGQIGHQDTYLLLTWQAGNPQEVEGFTVEHHRTSSINGG